MPQVIRDRRHGCAWVEDGVNALLSQCRHVIRGDDAPRYEYDIVQSARIERLSYLRKERQMGSRKNADADSVRILLKGRLRDVKWRPAEAQIHDLEAAVSKPSRDDTCSNLVAVKPYLCHNHSQ